MGHHKTYITYIIHHKTHKTYPIGHVAIRVRLQNHGYGTSGIGHTAHGMRHIGIRHTAYHIPHTACSIWHTAHRQIAHGM